MSTKLSDIAMAELSLVFAEKDGKTWGPRNSEALVLSTKAGESKPPLAQLLDKVKAWYNGQPAEKSKEDQIVSAVVKLTADLAKDFSEGDDDGRSATVKATLDNFLETLDVLRAKSEDTTKAGKRHSAADQAHIDAIGQANAKLTSALAAASEYASTINEHHAGLQPGDANGDGVDGNKPDSDAADKARAEAVKAVEAWKAGAVAEDGLPENIAEYLDLCVKAGKSDSDSKKPYGDVEYADPGYRSDGQHRYPVDTEEHARAAWSYINKESNASKYSSEDLAKVKGKIRAACDKFGIKLEGGDDSKAGEIEMTSEELTKIVADATKAAAKEAADAATAAATEQFKTVLEGVVKAQAEAGKTEAEKAAAAVETAKAAADKAKADLAAAEAIINAAARQPSATSGGDEAHNGVQVVTKGSEKNPTRLYSSVKAANLATGMASAQSREDNAALNVGKSPVAA